MLAIAGAYCPYILQAGEAPRYFPWKLLERRLPHYVLVTSLEGSEQIVVDGKAYAVSTGQSYLIQPNQLADLTSKAGNRPVWIHFDLMYNTARSDYGLVESHASELGPRAKLLQPSTKEIYGVELPVLVPKELALVFRKEVPRIAHERCGADDFGLLECNLSLQKLLLAWVDWRRRELGVTHHLDIETRLRRAEALAQARLGTAFSVSDFAEAAGLSRAHFSTLYREKRGLAPGTYLRNERMRLACYLLETTELSVGKIGSLVGYGEPSAFGRVFRSFTHQSPKEFRALASQSAAQE
jgi:AraC-like DNA-binding protein